MSLITNNYTTNKHVTERVTENVNITEKRAPTDESVRLLNEMQYKSLENIVSHFKVESNIIKGEGVFVQANISSMNTQIAFKINLNGTSYNLISTIEYETMNQLRKSNFRDTQLIVNTIKEIITELLVNNVLKDLLPETVKLLSTNPNF